MSSIRCAHASSTAKSFLRIASREYSSAATRPTPGSAPLEFLIPRCASKRMSPRGTAAQGAPTLRGCTFMAPMDVRRFSASPARKATVCVRNPLKDEDGNDMILEITPRAAKRLSTIMTKDANPNLGLRIQVESGGCHGFQYVMSLVTIPPPEDPKRAEVVREDDTIFQFAEDGAAPVPEAPRIILDEPSLDLLKGSKVDFTQELIGSQFKIVDNPLATSSCGCGTSFDIKA